MVTPQANEVMAEDTRQCGTQNKYMFLATRKTGSLKAAGNGFHSVTEIFWQ